MEVKTLFQPIQIGPVTVKNRFVMPPGQREASG